MPSLGFRTPVGVRQCGLGSPENPVNYRIRGRRRLHYVELYPFYRGPYAVGPGKPSGQAVVALDGRDIYVGNWNTKASRTDYDRLIEDSTAVWPGSRAGDPGARQGRRYPSHDSVYVIHARELTDREKRRYRRMVQ